MQICPYCQQEYEVNHLNRKYCSDKCRITHNNRKARKKRLQKKAEYSDTVEAVNRILMQNRKLLQQYVGKQLEVGKLKKEGFNFSFVTGYKNMKWRNKQKETIYFCYEYAYRIVNQKTIAVINRPLERDADRELLQNI